MGTWVRPLQRGRSGSSINLDRLVSVKVEVSTLDETSISFEAGDGDEDSGGENIGIGAGASSIDS